MVLKNHRITYVKRKNVKYVNNKKKKKFIHSFWYVLEGSVEGIFSGINFSYFSLKGALSHRVSLISFTSILYNNNNNVNCLLKIKLHFITLDINFKHVNIFTSLLKILLILCFSALTLFYFFLHPLHVHIFQIRTRHKMLLWVIPHYF